MKTIATLIRLAKREVDQLMRLLADAEGRRAAADARIAALDARVVVEQGIAAQSAMGGAAYGAFAFAAREDRAALVRDAEYCAAEVDHMRALLEAAYAELKKLEKLAEWGAERRAADALKRENATFDETAITRAAREG
ncbi:MAG: hypothetical protein GC189_07265 [Alphaproteobacteria bacterium]|nr:hypothetical protein [Alphaproteobacteria bacterium]